MHRITLQHRSRLLRINPRRYFIASGVSLLIMYSKFTIPPLVEIRPVITKRVTFRFRAIRPTLTPDVIYCNPFRIISRLFLFPQLGGATLTTTTPPTPAQIAGISVVLFAAILITKIFIFYFWLKLQKVLFWFQKSYFLGIFDLSDFCKLDG